MDVQGYKLGLNRAWCNVKWLVDLLNRLKYKLKYPISTEVRCVGPIDSFFFQRYVPTITSQRTGYYSHCRLGNTLKVIDYESIERTAKTIKELILEVDKRKIKKEIGEEIEKEMEHHLKSNIYTIFK